MIVLLSAMIHRYPIFYKKVFPLMIPAINNEIKTNFEAEMLIRDRAIVSNCFEVEDIHIQRS